MTCLEFISSISGVIVAIIAALTAFILFDYKQKKNKKHEVYDTMFKSISALNRKASEGLSSLVDVLRHNDEISNDTLNKANINISKIDALKAQTLEKRYLIYLFTSDEFKSRFREFEETMISIEQCYIMSVDRILEDGAEPRDYLISIQSFCSSMFEATEKMIKENQGIIDDDLSNPISVLVRKLLPNDSFRDFRHTKKYDNLQNIARTLKEKNKDET